MFSKSDSQIKMYKIELDVPQEWKDAAQALYDMHKANDEVGVVIGGGALRSLYMRQYMQRDACVKDVDFFVQCGPCGAQPNEAKIFEMFGTPIQKVKGIYDDDPFTKWRYDIMVPEDQFGTTLMQIGVSDSDAFSSVERHLTRTNFGINQIAYDVESGHVYVSELFLKDMQDKTITMNPDNAKNIMQWEKMVKKAQDFLDRPEFEGFGMITCPPPVVPENDGNFFEEEKETDVAGVVAHSDNGLDGANL